MVTDVLELLDVTPNFGWIDAGRRWTSGAKSLGNQAKSSNSLTQTSGSLSYFSGRKKTKENLDLTTTLRPEVERRFRRV